MAAAGNQIVPFNNNRLGLRQAGRLLAPGLYRWLVDTYGREIFRRGVVAAQDGTIRLADATGRVLYDGAQQLGSGVKRALDFSSPGNPEGPKQPTPKMAAKMADNVQFMKSAAIEDSHLVNQTVDLQSSMKFTNKECLGLRIGAMSMIR